MARSLSLGVLGLVLAALVLELALRLLPVSTATVSGYHHDPRVLTYPSGHRWTVSTGWDLRNAQRLRANNLGFASDVDFVPDAGALALVGDSHVEASMLDAAQRPAAQLAAALQGRRAVYAMGGPGSSLLDYAERIRLASERLQVRDFVVVLEQADLRQALCGSGNVHGACLDPATLQPRHWQQPAPSAAKRVLRHSALAQYVFGQLKVDPARLPAQAFAADVHPAPAAARPAAMAGTPAQQAESQRMVDAVAAAFFARIAPHATGRLVLLVDGRHQADAGARGDADRSLLFLERQRFIALARARGLRVVDAEAAYARHWARSTLSLDVGPQDRHLNGLGVALLMQAVAEELQ